MIYKQKLYLKTFGCQMNVNDSEYIIGQLVKLGYSTTEDIFKSNLILLNTCCVRAKVEQKIYSLIGKIKGIKESNPDVILGICGCMAQKEKENIFTRAPYVDFIFSPSQINNLEEIVSIIKCAKKKYISCENTPEFSLDHLPIKRRSKISAWIQIMRGCNNYCSYCVVPYTRGPEQSRGVSEILSEVNNLAKNKYREIFLLGQNVNSYGNDLSQSVTFSKLLELLNDINGIERIRFTTSHPKDFSFDLIETIKNCHKVCNHIHLPIQSASSKILKIMNRKYDIDYYKNIIKEIRDNIDNISITTDVMVGFPGETEDDFLDTLRAFKEIEFDEAYTFIYSNRENAVASLLPDQVPLELKKERLGKLIDLQKEISAKINKKLEGKTFEVLVDKKSKKHIENQFSGRTETNKTVVFISKQDLLGQLVEVKIIKSSSWTLYGELIE
ncbi:tRNA (N6-isopentenyl adenosine(37)-C2)-methylthiotransferase MiaB [Candidatus Atribacteria bacterium RBG_19FT_COMBO_35_14]|uniref:tRNA-2-methylthio-N(6)-dimethylallyladenosine synthase n=1 Tax=Candidatus Sediminicultor quintus TaxID=1797291 RepID=A0A1F5A645_9BACT|nr:MAG: tRNA (N6-isopentenyl adenosine(37)-C2)-methylthiotransferase MiaB [Candidatus Atribacteria bacterium RBG_19FT_COMBO_35_14]